MTIWRAALVGDGPDVPPCPASSCSADGSAALLEISLKGIRFFSRFSFKYQSVWSRWAYMPRSFLHFGPDLLSSKGAGFISICDVNCRSRSQTAY